MLANLWGEVQLTKKHAKWGYNAILSTQSTFVGARSMKPQPPRLAVCDAAICPASTCNVHPIRVGAFDCASHLFRIEAKRGSMSVNVKPMPRLARKYATVAGVSTKSSSL